MKQALMRAWWLAAAAATSPLAAVPLAAQGGAPVAVEIAMRGPRFLSGVAPGAAAIDPAGVESLRRKVTLPAGETTVGAALSSIARQTGVRLLYSRDVVPLDAPVRLDASRVSMAAALTEVLLDAEVDVAVTGAGQLVLVRRAAVAPVQTGSIVGRVTDAATAAALEGATVVIEGSPRTATTGSDGRYRIADLTPGTYTVRARYIGYKPGSASVVVVAAQEATAEFALTKSPQVLNEVVTTGTVIPTEVKAVPTPVTILSDSDIAIQHPQTIMQVFRQAVPSAVAWDIPAYPVQTAFSARGATTFNPGSGQMKVLIDGVEAASAGFAAIDPKSIGRIEVVRGPQAATIYGSDAIDGVIQITTKRGDSTLVRPQVDAEASVGLLQSPYAQYSGAARQAYSASVRGGAGSATYNFGGGYSRTGAYVADGQQSNPSAYGSVQLSRGKMTVGVTGRYYVQNNPQTYDPAIYDAGLVSLSKPFFEHYQYSNQTLGAHLSFAAKPWWHHTLTLGIDRFGLDEGQTQRRLTTPGDTLLLVYNQTQTKTAIGYNTSLTGSLASGIDGSIVVGFDHYSLPLRQFLTSGALSTTGNIETVAGIPITAVRTTTNNTGYFAQAQLGFRDALFLTLGARAEQNSNFGDSLGLPISPRAGITYARRVGGSFLKFRGSWGRAIRPPSPGLKLAFESPSGVLLANPDLGPERQEGWDAGVDAVVGTNLVLSATYYDQTADGLIQEVVVPGMSVNTAQNQNIGRVKNSGVELQAGLTFGSVEVKGQYAYTRSRVAALAPGYAGDLRIGDQSLLTPTHTAGASFSFSPLVRTRLNAGLTYVGSWKNYSALAEYRCFGGTSPCPAGVIASGFTSFRDFIVSYPGFVKLTVGVSQAVGPLLSGFVQVSNLTNNRSHEQIDSVPVLGRTTTVGLQLHY